MKTLKFNFSHPFKGNARINMPGKLNSPCKHLLLDSQGSNLVEIPLSDFQSGKYNIMLDWEVGNRLFFHQQEFEISRNSGN
jgi:hypothetical protein